MAQSPRRPVRVVSVEVAAAIFAPGLARRGHRCISSATGPEDAELRDGFKGSNI